MKRREIIFFKLSAILDIIFSERFTLVSRCKNELTQTVKYNHALDKVTKSKSLFVSKQGTNK